MPNYIRFGIPSFDALLGTAQGEDLNGFGIRLEDPRHSTSTCLAGPEGTGKSIFALHLASRFAADTVTARAGSDENARIVYISTDLSHDMADRVWRTFDLCNPNGRHNPFTPEKYSSEQVRVELARKRPISDGPSIVDGGSSETQVAFIDLANESAGDDWGYVARLIAALPPPPENTLHLIIIDALEGFETLAGEEDAFGEPLSRRSRIAQVMRLAAGRAHVLFVVEEARSGLHRPEHFVSDVVIQLHSSRVRRYARRTVEIRKVRGQTHARGRHEYTIRSGAGSTTGRGEDQMWFTNYDDPRVLKAGRQQGYLLVFHSLHYQSRRTMERVDRDKDRRDVECHSFGIRYLDDILADRGLGNTGLPNGTVTALIGDHGTQKTRLAHSYLAETFQPLLADLHARFSIRSEERLLNADFDAVAAEIFTNHQKDVGAAVLITTQDTDAEELAQRFSAWFIDGLEIPDARRNAARNAVAHELVKRIVCRRLENHDLPSSILLHIVREAISAAKVQRIPEGGRKDRVRVVLDDFSTWKEIYLEIRQEPLFLPFLLFYLRRENITTVIVDTQSGTPDTTVLDPFDSELRALVDHHIYTWRVPFYGESRIAIAPIPPLSNDSRSVVRELRWSPATSVDQDHRPEVDPHFELYTGLEVGRPEPVPLRIVLFNEAPQFIRYIDDENIFYSTRFTPLRTPDRAPAVIHGVTAAEYEALRSLGTERDTRLDHTLVFQVDEFWYSDHGPGTFRPGTLRSQQRYLNEVAWTQVGGSDFSIDPRGVFRPGKVFTYPADDSGVGNEIRRVDLFDNLDDGVGGRSRRHVAVDRIPFMWDFGFLLCPTSPWAASKDREVPAFPNSLGRVRDIWASLPKAFGRGDELGSGPSEHDDTMTHSRASWREFLGACKVVAHVQNQSNRTYRPFDLALVTAESLSCLIFEIWASEISSMHTRHLLTPSQIDAFERMLGGERNPSPLGDGDGQPRGLLLAEAVRHFGFPLYTAFLLLIDTLDLQTCASPNNAFDCATRESHSDAVAVRHWYKSACASQDAVSDEPSGCRLPVGLPGNYSTRGDWFLATAGASRSSRLADHALDLLSSRRANFARMQMGLGLPTRIISRESRKIRTALIAPTSDQSASIRNVAYDALRSLGSNGKGFGWIWRSSLMDYDLMSRIWQKWIARVIIAWAEFKADQGESWSNGFLLYDRSLHHNVANFPDSNVSSELKEWDRNDAASHAQFRSSAVQFQGLCELLAQLLDDASVDCR